MALLVLMPDVFPTYDEEVRRVVDLDGDWPHARVYNDAGGDLHIDLCARPHNADDAHKARVAALEAALPAADRGDADAMYEAARAALTANGVLVDQ